jgi:hypothetical protein
MKRPDAGCAPINPHCVSVDVANSPQKPTACSWSQTDPGTYAHRSLIHLNTGYTGWPSDEARQWAVAHELVHVLGIDDQDSSCDNVDSIMHVPPSCGETTDENGNPFATAPTQSDVWPLTKTMYGPGSRKTCG